MFKHFIFVILLTLGIVSVVAQGGTKNGQVNVGGETAEFKIIVKIQQLCCENNEPCKTIENGRKCEGTLKVVLECETTPGDSSNNVSEGEMVISVNDNLQLLRSIDKMIVEQYDSNAIIVTGQPRELSVDNEHKINAVKYSAKDVVPKEGLGGELIKMPKYFPTPSTNPVTPIGFTLDEVKIIRQEVLHKANYYRSMFGIHKLTSENNLNQYSQKWANQLASEANHLSVTSTLKKSNSQHYGEILFTSYPVKYVGEVAVDFSFYEVADVDRSHEHTDYYVFKNEKTKRLNQLLWMRSEDIGVGASIGQDGKYIVVMNFNAMGNVDCFMLENVPIFTNELLEEARKKLDVIDAKRNELLKNLNIRIPILPGWQTMLYDSEFNPNATSKYNDKPKK